LNSYNLNSIGPKNNKQQDNVIKLSTSPINTLNTAEHYIYNNLDNMIETGSSSSPKSIEKVVLNLNDLEDFETLIHTTPVMSVQREDTVLSTTSLDVIYDKATSPSKSIVSKNVGDNKKVIDEDRIKFYSKILKRPSFSTSDKYLSIRSRSMASIHDLKLNKLNNKPIIPKSSSSDMIRKKANAYYNDLIKNKQIDVKKYQTEKFDRNRIKAIAKLPVIDKVFARASYKVTTNLALSGRSRSVPNVFVGITDKDLSRKNIISPNKDRNDHIKKINYSFKASEARRSRTNSPERKIHTGGITIDLNQQQKVSLEKKMNSMRKPVVIIGMEKLKVTKENLVNKMNLYKSKVHDKNENMKAITGSRKSPMKNKEIVKENNDILNKKISTSLKGHSEHSVSLSQPKLASDRISSPSKSRSLSPMMRTKNDVMFKPNIVVNDRKRNIYNTPSSDKRIRERSKSTNSNSIERSKNIIAAVSPSNLMVDIENDKLLVSKVERYNLMLHELLDVDNSFVNDGNKNNESSVLPTNKKPETDEILARVDKYNQRLNYLLANITKSPSSDR